MATDFKLTPEIIAKLKSNIGFTVDSLFKYIPKAFRELKDEIPRDAVTIFLLESKNGIQAATAEDRAGFITYDQNEKTGKMHLESGKQRLETLRNGIHKIRNFWIDNGSNVMWDKKSRTMIITDSNGEEHKSNEPVDTIIKMMTVDMQIELQNAINERSILTDEELMGLEC